MQPKPELNEEQAVAATIEYNTVFETLVDPENDDYLIRLVAYGLYKTGKREWVLSKNRRPTPEEFAAYASTQTPMVLTGYITQARDIVDGYAESMIAAAKPGIEHQALRGTFATSVYASLVASVIFAGVLALIVIVAAINGWGLPLELMPVADPTKPSG